MSPVVWSDKLAARSPQSSAANDLALDPAFSTTAVQEPSATPLATPSPLEAKAENRPQVDGRNVAAIVIPSVLGPLLLITLIAIIAHRRQRRRAKAPSKDSFQARAGAQTPGHAMRQMNPSRSEVSVNHIDFPTVSHDSLPTPMQKEKKLFPDADLAPSPPVAPQVQDDAASQFVEPPVQAPWRPEPLPASPTADPDHVSTHSRSASLAERRNQRLLRALADAPPLPGTAL
ncbi:hypothetical protein AURDEDRAFT_112656 [Auricularia subglabra TFB-10046 SS5]|nr:hypothetical protein AURDEDRAFT_112656 [Auricularia subglabra TFB-10046 SS5]